MIGFICSLALLALSAYLTYVPSHLRAAYDADVAFDSAGILQLVWLLGAEPRLADIRKPDVGALRKAGMFGVRMSEKAAQRAHVDGGESDTM